MNFKLILISSLLLSATAAWADEQSLCVEIEALREQLAATQEKLAQVETTAGLLMAAYQHDQKIKAYRQEQKRIQPEDDDIPF